ncbi:MAG: aminotransferase class V-fold PLP-dependent enzyme [Chloroflexi bacterium]|nr:aminotransferase class V-fold PLP-dependent enzyme [Chloroflexota bacterium]
MANTNNAWDVGSVHQRLGVTPIINAAGSITRLGGSRTRPETLQLMSQAARVMVNIDDLNRAAGKELARLTGAEAGFVCSGAAGGLVLQAAAVIAGNDPVKMRQLPNTDGLKNEIVIHTMHRFPYDQAYRAAGAHLVEFGDYLFAHPWQLEGAINERTAAVAYLVAPFSSNKVLPLERVCEIAHARDVPVIVDAASMLPPRANLYRYLRDGADMVVYSGGKGIRGPQGSGILVGRADLIEAAAAQANPAQFLGRGMKVAKEEVIGLVASLAAFVEEDEAAEMEAYRAMVQPVVDALVELPGLRVTLEHDRVNYLLPQAAIYVTDDWRGPSRDAVLAALEQGNPQIHLQTLAGPQELAVDPLNLTEAEVETVIRRLREELTRQG